MFEKLFGVTRRRYIDVVRILTERYVKVRYRGSSLGVFWSVLNPLIMTTVYALVFGHAFRGFYGTSVIDYPLAVFIGFVAMNFFSTATSQALHGVVTNGLLMNKMRVPPSVFPAAIVASNAVQFVVGVIPLLIILTLVVSHNPIGIPLLIPPLLALALVTMGTAFLVSALYVFFRDIPHLYELAVFVIFVATPVFYPLSIVDKHVRPLIQWSPISLIIEQLRAAVVLDHVPTLASIGVSLAWGVGVFAIGLTTFVRWTPKFMDRL